MRYKMWTGPTQVKAIAEAMKLVPDTTNVLDGTEYVYFTSPHTPRGIERLAHTIGDTRIVWPHLDGMRRISHLDAHCEPVVCTLDLNCEHCVGSGR